MLLCTMRSKNKYICAFSLFHLHYIPRAKIENQFSSECKAQAIPADCSISQAIVALVAFCQVVGPVVYITIH